jgi:acyl-CoA dehydrogenase
MSTLAAGLFADNHTPDEDSDLRSLVDDLGRRSYEAGLGLRRAPCQFDAALWRNLEDTGLSRMTSATDSAAGLHHLAIALYGVARHAGAVPFAETAALADWLAVQAGFELPSGPTTVAIADLDSSRTEGTAHDVPWARACSTIVLALRGADHLRVGVLDTASCTLSEKHNRAGEPRDSVDFHLTADRLHSVPPALHTELLRRGAWSRCVQIIGALDGAAALTVQHTRQRSQFGRPISAFQSVQQSLAGMAGDIERARAAVEVAVAAADEHGFDSGHTDHAVTVAKVAVGRVVGPVTTVAHQLHGAIGVTSEHPLWWFTMRAQSWLDDYGSTNHFARRLGRRALEVADPWDLVTGDLDQLEAPTAIADQMRKKS